MINLNFCLPLTTIFIGKVDDLNGKETMTNMMKIDQTIISRSSQYPVRRQDEVSNDNLEALR